MSASLVGSEMCIRDRHARTQAIVPVRANKHQLNFATAQQHNSTTAHQHTSTARTPERQHTSTP
eukprot:3820576-Alexandrium_andersonii.AAC.1